MYMCLKQIISNIDPLNIFKVQSFFSGNDEKDYIFDCFDSLEALRKKQIQDKLQSFLPKNLYIKFFCTKHRKSRQEMLLLRSDSEIKMTDCFHLNPCSVKTESGQ